MRCDVTVAVQIWPAVLCVYGTVWTDRRLPARRRNLLPLPPKNGCSIFHSVSCGTKIFPELRNMKDIRIFSTPFLMFC